jgi:mRNA interferase MazF
LRRGDVVVTVLPGSFGKPRPALVVQSNLFDQLPTVVVCPFSTTIREDAGMFRIDIDPSSENGLLERSQLAIDKIVAVPMTKIGQVVGSVDDAFVSEVDERLALFLGLA